MAAVKAVACAGLKLCEPLLCVGLKAVLHVPEGVIEAGAKWVKERFTDHSLVLTKAVSTAHDRAWQAVALALATDNLFSHVANLFRDGDLKAVQKQIREFVATADTGLDGAAAGLRTKACHELLTLKKAGRFALDGADLISVDLTRFASAAKVADDAHRAVTLIAADLTADAPHLAQVLNLTPPAGGTPLLAAAFAYFLRREIATKPELARELTHDQLRLLTLKQQAGFSTIEQVIDAKSGELLEVLGGWFATAYATQEEMLAILRKLATDHRVPTQAEAPSEITISTEEGRAKLREVFQKVLSLPAEFVQTELLQLLGDDCAAAGLFSEALRAQTAAAAAAKEAADRAAEADCSFRAYKSACECQPPDYPAALEHLMRAAALDPVRFSPFDRGRYHPLGILGHGGFGTVFLCSDRDDPDHDGVPQKVAVKTFRAECLDHDPAKVFAEAQTLRKLHRPDSRFVRIIHWDYAQKDAHDPAKRERPYIVMEYFPGETLDKLANGGTTFTPAQVVNLFRQIAEAVHDAHQKAVYHRDLKPSNVMARNLGDDIWEVRVIDFGLAVKSSTAARASQKQAGGESTKADRSFTGTWDFAPPEQRGKAPHIKPGPWSDVYAFGKTLAWVLFKTTEPKGGHWKKLPDAVREPLKGLFEGCTYDELRTDDTDEDGRLRSFDPVLDVLRVVERATDPTAKRAEEARRAAERQANEEQERRRKEAEQNAREERLRREKEADERRKERAERERLAAELEEAKRKQAELLREQEATRAAAERMSEELRKREEDDRRREEVRRQADAEQKARKEAQRQIDMELERQEQERLDTERRRAEEARKAVRKAGDPFALDLPGGVKMAFAWCPPGTFLMGSPASEKDRRSDEQQHEVRLTKGFYAGVHPVTRGEFARFVAESKYKTEAERSGGGHKWTGTEWKLDAACNWRNPGFTQDDSHPVTVVSWNDAVAFCKWLADQSKQKVRLPTEAEWEYMCRGGMTTPFYWGGELNGTQANIDGNYPYGTSTKGPYLKATSPVGSYAKRYPHPWGLADIHGNVWEWCADWYDAGFYARSPKDDPECRDGEQKYRVLRGGSWCSHAGFCRAAVRNWGGPARRGDNYGFRVVLCLD